MAATLQRKRLEKFRSLPVTEPDENSNAYKYIPPVQPKGKAMSLTVSLMGVTNAGKSTLVNRFVGTFFFTVACSLRLPRQRLFFYLLLKGQRSQLYQRRLLRQYLRNLVSLLLTIHN